jgi:hypothetical protein
MDYTDLFNTIKTYCENDFPTTSFTGNNNESIINSLGSTQINTFIMQAEERIYNTVQLPALRKNVTGSLTSGNQYLSCPADFLSSYSLAVIDPTTGNYTFLLNKDVNFIRESYPTTINNGTTYQGTPQGTPKYYSLFGSQINSPNALSFMLGPTPDQNYLAELHYFFYPPSIVKGIITSYNLTQAGSGYVNGIYYNIPLTGGQGTSALADITISNNTITSFDLVDGGSLYGVGDQLSAPAASLGGTVTTPFYITVQAINNASGTSWVGDNYPPSLLYGSLVEAYTFMKGEADIIAQYEKKYQEAMIQLKRLGDGLERNDAYRKGQTSLQYNQL